MSNVDIDSLSLTQAMRGLRDRTFSSMELVRAVYQRYEQTEPELLSFVELYTDDAVAQAAVADRRLALSKSPPPLLGIPIAIKDIFDVAGKPTVCNSELRRDAAVADRDSEPVHRMRLAGAVLWGKTVTQEFAAGVISAPARNPWNTDRIPGGSSGGSAASIAAGTSLGALGSDTGGSIRIPASLTATVGLKPTYGRIDLKGVFPLSASLDTAGPIARTVADVAVMHLALTRRLPEVWETASAFERAAASPSLKGRRIGVLASIVDDRMQAGVRSSFEAALESLHELGAEIVECDWEDIGAARASALLIQRIESAAVHHRALRDSPDGIGEDTRLRFEVGALLSGDVYLRARAARQAARQSIAALYAAHNLDAIAAPTLPATAPPRSDTRVRYDDGTVEAVGPAMTRFTLPWNATGQPVISVPCGFDQDTLPIGLSLVGRPDDELRLCEIAQAYERATRWYLRRPALPSGPETAGTDHASST